MVEPNKTFKDFEEDSVKMFSVFFSRFTDNWSLNCLAVTVEVGKELTR